MENKEKVTPTMIADTKPTTTCGSSGLFNFKSLESGTW